MQDAILKWRVADYDVAEILFIRSCFIVAVSGFLVRFRDHLSVSSVVLSASLMFFAWLLFYNAARHFELAQLTTLNFSWPIIVVFLSIWTLKEKVDAALCGNNSIRDKVGNSCLDVGVDGP